MKYFKTFEYVKNYELMKSILYSIINKLKKVDNEIKFQSKFFSFDGISDGIKIRINTSKTKKILNILNQLKEFYLNQHYYIYWFIEIEGGFLTLMIKEFKLKRVKPKKFIYHITKGFNLNSIIEKGLKVSDPINHSELSELYYEKAIFATNTEIDNIYNYKEVVLKVFLLSSHYIIIKIDTEKLNNKWYEDLNFYNEKTSNIMTFENITVSAIDSIYQYIYIAEGNIDKIIKVY